MGAVASLVIGSYDYDKAKATAIRYARAKHYPIVILSQQPGRLTFRRVTLEESKTVMYPEMDMLQIGQSHLFEVAKPVHQRVRMAASVRNRRGAVLLSCTTEGPFIRVTRHSLTTDEMKAHGPIAKPDRASKYGLENLATQRELHFKTTDFAEILRIRSSVAIKRKLTGWDLATRVQFDGTLIVTRLDLQGGAP